MQIRNALTTNISLIGKLLALADGDNINDVEDDGNGEHEDLSASVEGSLRDWMSLLDGHDNDLLEYSNALQALIQMVGGWSTIDIIKLYKAKGWTGRNSTSQPRERICL